METKNLKPFDLEKAKAGAKLVTRNGKPARIICWDRGHKTDHIVALVEYTEDGESTEETMTYTDQGTFYDNGNESCFDLFIAPTVVERWVNVYKLKQYSVGTCYRSEEEAENNACADCIATIKLAWEE